MLITWNNPFTSVWYRPLSTSLFNIILIWVIPHTSVYCLLTWLIPYTSVRCYPHLIPYTSVCCDSSLSNPVYLCLILPSNEEFLTSLLDITFTWVIPNTSVWCDSHVSNPLPLGDQMLTWVIPYTSAPCLWCLHGSIVRHLERKDLGLIATMFSKYRSTLFLMQSSNKELVFAFLIISIVSELYKCGP